MEAKVAEQAQPWFSAYQALIGEGYAQLGASRRPVETMIHGGDGRNYATISIDIQRAYLLAVRWKVTGDAIYADKAVEFLDAWQYAMTGLAGNADRRLAAGIYGSGRANVAELLFGQSSSSPFERPKRSRGAGDKRMRRRGEMQ